MVEIIENKDITSFTTFGIPVKARYFAEYSSERELLALSRKEEFNAAFGKGAAVKTEKVHDRYRSHV